MSEIWLFVALVGTFAAIAAAVLSVGSAARAGHRRTVEILESQVEPVPVTSLREHELVRPFGDRAMKPMLGTVARAGRRLTPLDVRKRLARKLVLAGSPAGWDADRLAAYKVGGLVVGVVLGVFLGHAFVLAGLTLFIMVASTTAMGYFGPDLWVTRMAEDRQKRIQRALPDTMDLLTISVEAGLGFDAALAQVVEHVPGPLSEEIARMLQEVQLGKPRADAFRNLGERSSVDELNAFVLSIIQADIFGISVSKVLRSQAKELRLRRRQRAERAGMQIPVKIVFPTILCILPSLFVVILGPGAIRIIQNFSGVI
jgi:tight adherence protein C